MGPNGDGCTVCPQLRSSAQSWLDLAGSRESELNIMRQERDAARAEVERLKQEIADNTEDDLRQADEYLAVIKEQRDEKNVLRQQIKELVLATAALRTAQRLYLADRGNEEKGRAVGRAAAMLDMELLKAYDAGTRKEVNHDQRAGSEEGGD